MNNFKGNINIRFHSEISIKGMFPSMPDNCDALIDLNEDTYYINDEHYHRIYYMVDGNIIDVITNYGKYYTVDMCKKLGFDEETTLLWVLMYGEYLPKFCDLKEVHQRFGVISHG